MNNGNGKYIIMPLMNSLISHSTNYDIDKINDIDKTFGCNLVWGVTLGKERF